MQERGKPFGNYMLLERLARGGMAEVFLAEQRGPEGFDRRVAVKRILPHLMDSEDFVRMFHDEARLAARLSHPNVVHIYEFGKVDEHHFIAMEFVDGVHAGALIEYGATDPIPPALVARIAADACAGLNHAHRLTDSSGNPLHLVHRDISPPNLMISYDGVVKLVDFGIAKAVDMAGKTRPGIVKGKFAYMSPEQTMGKKLDGRSDVFSLGMVIWELLAGRVALDRTDPVEVMKSIRDGRVPSIRQARPDVPPELAHVLEMALQNKRENRPNAAELGNAFEAYIKASPELATSMQLAEWVGARFQRKVFAPSTASHQGPNARGPSARHANARDPDARDANLASMAFLHGDDDDDGATQQMSAAHIDLALLPRAGSIDHGASGPGASPPSAAPNAAPMAPHTPMPAPLPPPGFMVTGAPDVSDRRRRHIILAAVAIAVVIGLIMISVGASDNGGSSGSGGASSDGVADELLDGGALAGSSDSAESDGGGTEPDTQPDKNTAWLVIETEPEGATVALDGGDPKNSPALFDDLTVGTHDISIELSGYIDHEESIALPAGQSEFSFTLQKEKEKKPRGKGKLNVFTRPSCTAYLGKKKLRTTPFAGLKVSPGSYVLECKKSGYKTATQRVRVRSGKTTKVKLTLVKQ